MQRMMAPSYRKLLVIGGFLFVTSPGAFADFISGQVVDVNGIGVQGVDIDVENLGSGGDPDIFNDGTDANGFFLTTIPAGIYRVSFKPPPPPTTTHLTATVDDVIVIGTTNMGVISLPPGVGITGRCLDTLGFPVGNVNLDVFDLLIGEQLILKGGSSDLFGNFGVAVPANDIYLDFDPKAVPGRNLVPIRMSLSPTMDMDLGNIVLTDGVILSGTLHDSLALPVVGVDLDVFDSATGTKIFTPHDNSNLMGMFSIVLNPGLYDIEICPAFVTRLVARDQEGFPILVDTNAGILILENGAVLSGTVRDVTGTPVPGMDVDVARSLTQASVVTCNDDTDALGAYALIVPFDTLDIGFAPPGRHMSSAEDLHAGVVITGDTTLDGTIPAPLAAPQGSPRAGLAPLRVSFTDLSTGAVTSWFWNFGDSSTSSLRNPQHIYTLPGIYDVALTVGGIGGNSTRTELAYVDVQPPPPAASFTAVPLSGQVPLSVAFSDLSTGAVTAWAWDFGDLTASTQQSPLHTYAIPGVFSVTLTAMGPTGNSTHTELNYVTAAEPAPVADFVGSPLSGAIPLTVNFTDLSTGPVSSRLWNFGDSTTSTLQNPFHAYTAAGTYAVAMTATGPGGMHTTTKLDYVTAGDPAPVADFVGSPLSGTIPLTVNFTDLSTGPVSSRLWDFGDSTTSTLQNPFHAYTAAGTYTVAMTAMGPGGSDTSTKLNYIAASEVAPVADFVGMPREGVTPLTVSFLDLSTGPATSWSWDFGDLGASTQRNPIHTYTTLGVYTVSLTASGPGGTSTSTELDYVAVSRPRLFRGVPPSGVVSRPAPTAPRPPACPPVAATLFSYNGTGINLDSLATGPLIIGSPWALTMTPQATRGAGSWIVLVRSTPTSVILDWGTFFLLPPAGLSELLVGAGFLANISTTTPHAGFGTPVSTTVSIPPLCSLVGSPWHAQALVLGDLPSGAGLLDPRWSSAMGGTIGTN